jgi:hypothetical protein
MKSNSISAGRNFSTFMLSETLNGNWYGYIATGSTYNTDVMVA